MRFRQLDQITKLQPGAEIRAERTLTGDDVYFRDHFPQFPVLPGVLSLESMFQACDWLLRETDGFSKSAVLLKEIRGLKFAGFVRPGQTFSVHAQAKKVHEESATFAARVSVDGQSVAAARLVLDRFNLSDRYPARTASDPYLLGHKRAQYRMLDPRSADHAATPPTNFRWMWLDRFTAFVKGQRAESIKTVSLTDEPLDLYMPGFPVMPCSLIIEGLAQTGGILISDFKSFEKPVVLAKISKAVFHRPALPGDTMTYSTEIEDIQAEGALVKGISRIEDELHAEVDLSFAYLDDRFGRLELIPPEDILSMLRLYGLYDVGQTDQGAPLSVPQHLLTAENAQVAAQL